MINKHLAGQHDQLRHGRHSAFRSLKDELTIEGDHPDLPVLAKKHGLFIRDNVIGAYSKIIEAEDGSRFEAIFDTDLWSDSDPDDPPYYTYSTGITVKYGSATEEGWDKLLSFLHEYISENEEARIVISSVSGVPLIKLMRYDYGFCLSSLPIIYQVFKDAVEPMYAAKGYYPLTQKKVQAAITELTDKFNYGSVLSYNGNTYVSLSVAMPTKDPCTHVTFLPIGLKRAPAGFALRLLTDQLKIE